MARQEWPRPARLFRQWKQAAGPAWSRFIPAAPFSGLAAYGPPLSPSGSLLFDQACRELATGVLGSLEAEAVRTGEAAFVLDLAGPVSLGLGFYLQQSPAQIAPVLLFAGLWRPDAVLDGGESAATLAYYGQRLNRPTKHSGYAFLLERERFDQVSPLQLIETFDNRYHAGLGLFPPVAQLRESNLKALIDLRLAGDMLPGDLAEFYESAAQAGLDIFQAKVGS